MKMKAYATFDEYFADQVPRNQTVIRALRQLVGRMAPHLEESVKWGNGCWLSGKAPVAYVYSAPDHVQFGFFGGSALKDPKDFSGVKGSSSGTSTSSRQPTLTTRHLQLS